MEQPACQDYPCSRGGLVGPDSGDSLLAELRVQLVQHERRLDTMLALHLTKIAALVNTQVVSHGASIDKFQPVAANISDDDVKTSQKTIQPIVRGLSDDGDVDSHQSYQDDLQVLLPGLNQFTCENPSQRVAAWGDDDGTSVESAPRDYNQPPKPTLTTMRTVASVCESVGFADQLEALENFRIKSTRLNVEFDAGDKSWQTELRRSTKRVLLNRRVEYVVSALIMFNAACMGAQIDWDVKHLHGAETTPSHFVFLESVFQVVFLIELVLRVIVEGRKFLAMSNSNIGWNVFDGALVLFSLFEWFMLAASGLLSEGDILNANVSFLRLFRVLRLVRAVRIVRVLRFFRDLRVMVAGIAASFKSLMWALLLLLLIMYVVAICIMQVGVDDLAGGQHAGATETAFLQNYGSLVRAIYTLYMAILGGIDWEAAADPLIVMHPVLIVTFMLYIAFGTLCVLNIVTGVFVENANMFTQNDEDHIRMEMLANKRSFYEKVKKIFEEADCDMNGRISREEFDKECDRCDVIAYLESIGIDMMVTTPAQIFNVFDFDNTGWIDLEAFASGLQKIHGPARSLDIIHLSNACQDIRKAVVKLSSEYSMNARMAVDDCAEPIPHHHLASLSSSLVRPPDLS